MAETNPGKGPGSLRIPTLLESPAAKGGGSSPEDQLREQIERHMAFDRAVEGGA